MPQDSSSAVTSDSGAPVAVADSGPVPETIGRYRVDRVLGKGGFGRVYLSLDTMLGRAVAIKVPHRHLVSSAADAEPYLAEARAAASLRHPGIVPVFDVGSADGFPFFVVTQFIEGGDLAGRLDKGPLSVPDAIRIAADVARALDHAHQSGLVHRDIKPANIFLDAAGRAHVGDFGLALREQEFGTGPRHAGTPQYMSPEQARGEGHRVDGRSDIFSLGVVMHEMLTGKRPFRASTSADLLDEIITLEVKPPRQTRPEIPRELERVCLKALSKRATERHGTAGDLADELESLLAERPPTPALAGAETRGGGSAPTPPATPRPDTPPVSGPLKIVPKGLRSFDESDKDFFLELLPGPRDRDGLPDTVRFWKRRLEEENAAEPLRVGLIYGPSGCGKSSLVKAGLLPRLAPSVRPLYLEATGTDTEARLLAGLRRLVPGLPPDCGLAGALKAARLGALPAGARALVIVIDQFEQWLHAKGAETETELVRALRQCDGDRLRAVVMVRDDFWLAVSRFLSDLEIPLREGVNARLVDLFDMPHARKVLAAYGRAHGALPDERVGSGDPELRAALARAEAWPQGASEARDGVRRAIDIAERDAEMALTRIRKVLEWVVRAVYEAKVGKPAGTNPLDNLIDRIVKDGHFPKRLEAYAAAVRKLGNLGTHGHGETVTVADVKSSLSQVEPIVAWHCGFEVAFAETTDAPSRAEAGENELFIAQAIEGLARDGKVVSVQIALLAEMVKARPWVPATLLALGGVEGIGVAFLEETFSAPGAPAGQRARQRPARAVLRALLPPPGCDIKGHMRARDELLRISGLAARPREFEDLIALLDGQLRLITPTDPEGAGSLEGEITARNYILTHDYLVPALREWLARKQRETSRGRAELVLAERASAWAANPSARQLPYLFQWLGILRHVPRRDWSPPERRMMAAALATHLSRGMALTAAMTLLVAGAWYAHGQFQARSSADRLAVASTAEVPAEARAIGAYRWWAKPLLKAMLAGDQPRARLHAAMALAAEDDEAGEIVSEHLTRAEPGEVAALLDSLEPKAPNLLKRWWELAGDGRAGPGRLRAAAALARFDPQGQGWPAVAPAVALDLVRENPVYLGAWSELLRPASEALFAPLERVFADANPDRAAERSLATNLLADWMADNPSRLADLLAGADSRQFAALYPPLAAHPERASELLARVLEESLPANLPLAEPRRETLATRQANAAVALLRLGQPDKVWPLLRHSPDPRVRSYLVHGLFPLGADARVVSQRLGEEPDLSARRALLLALGQFDEAAWPQAAREALLPMVRKAHEDADPGLHAAAEWLLRRWGQGAWLKATNDGWTRASLKASAPGFFFPANKANGGAMAIGISPAWFVNTRGMEFTAIPGPARFRMGSPETEAGRFTNETEHGRIIGRSFAIAAKSVTLAQYRQLTGDRYEIGENYTYDPDLPVVAINWYMAARFCNRLSKEEGIPEEQWCFEISGPKDGDIRLRKDYLKLTGYRLPTEAEYEYATRAGSRTSRCFGESDALLVEYGWYQKNSREKPHPVGLLKPNELGLFDSLGNCYSWCMEAYGDYPEGAESADKEGPLMIDSASRRVLRGGSFYIQPTDLRSAIRIIDVPADRNDYLVGFRLARTLPH